MATMTCAICGEAHNECRCPKCGADWKYQLSDEDHSADELEDSDDCADDYIVDKLLG